LSSLCIARGGCLARQRGLSFGPGAPRGYELALGRGIGLLRVEQLDQRRLAGAIGKLSKP